MALTSLSEIQVRPCTRRQLRTNQNIVETRQQIIDRIEEYAEAVRDRDPIAVANLFAERFDHVVYGVGSDPANPWNTKRETDREGIRLIYEAFFASAGEINVDYTDRVIDVEERSAAMIVRVRNEEVRMENALQIKWNRDGKIVFFHNWYGGAG